MKQLRIKGVQIILVVCLLMGLSVGPPALGATEIGIELNGQEQFYVERPVMDNGRVLLPMRALFEALGAQVQWDETTRSALGSRGQWSVQVPVNSSTVLRNGEPVILDVPARIIAGRTYIPVRFVAEAFGDSVFWVRETSTVRITSDWPDLRLRLSISEIEQRAGPSVVHVENRDSRGRPRRFGSGFLLEKTGLVITNFHVIEGARSLRLVVSGGSEHVVDRIVYADQERDLAMIRIERPAAPSLPSYRGALVKGEPVVVLGSPVGLVTPTTFGVITRSVRLVNGQLFVQTDAPIVQGNSGSPLLNGFGEVIGVMTAQLLPGDNLNLAIPIQEVLLHLETDTQIPLWELSRTGGTMQ